MLRTKNPIRRWQDLCSACQSWLWKAANFRANPDSLGVSGHLLSICLLTLAGAEEERVGAVGTTRRIKPEEQLR
jgi:hypothetical protein